MKKPTKVGITGQNGFIGSHLFNFISCAIDKIELVNFDKSFFQNQSLLDKFINDCDVIVHLAAINRSENQESLFNLNIEMVEKLIKGSKNLNKKFIFASSIQEENSTAYGRSKRKSRELFENWAIDNNGCVISLIIPNVFGPFGKPYYNSFIPTFCDLILKDQDPKIIEDNLVELIYVQDLVNEIIKYILEKDSETTQIIRINAHFKKKVSEVLNLLYQFKNSYFEEGTFPDLHNNFNLKLFNTFRSYIPLDTFFPKKFKLNTDNRGSFVELVKSNSKSQVSFSTTKEEITRGNHFHTRKVERFAVIRGKAKIELRKYKKNEVFSYILEGSEPSFIDMPVWFTHNIKNIGEGELYTVFWINEEYNPNDPDTYFEVV